MSPEQPGYPGRKLADQLRFSASKRIDGLWVGTTEREPLLYQVEEALRLIKVHDRRRYDRLVRDLALVWVRRHLGSNARFNTSRHACELDAGFVLAEPSKAIAAAIVHGATRARLRRLGLDPQDQRARVTEICVNRKLAFAARLPAGAQLPEHAELQRGAPRARWPAALRLAARLTSRLLDRIERRWATSRSVDGLWTGTCESEAEPLLRRVEEALTLIKAYDRRRYNRLLRDVERIWVRDDLGPDRVAQFDPALWACELDDWLVLSATTEELAATIVHEATHARLWRSGIGYDERLRPRVEAACFRRELAFAAKLPNGDELREDAERRLRIPDAYWSDAALLERTLERFTHYIRRLRELQAPDWLVRAMRAIRTRLRQKSPNRRSAAR
jgi:hypothetical protein